MNPGLPLPEAATGRLADVWVYLSATPLLGLTVTLLVYQGAFVLYRRSGFHPLANPVAIAVLAFALLDVGLSPWLHRLGVRQRPY